MTSVKRNHLMTTLAQCSHRKITVLSPVYQLLTIQVLTLLKYLLKEYLHFSKVRLDPCKACGPDNIPTRFLKEKAAELAPSFTLLYQASINQGRVPNELKKAKVVPVYKKGGRSLVSNYRPISPTCVLCKTLNIIIYL